MRAHLAGQRPHAVRDYAEQMSNFGKRSRVVILHGGQWSNQWNSALIQNADEFPSNSEPLWNRYVRERAIQRIFFEARPEPRNFARRTYLSETKADSGAERIIVVADKSRWNGLFQAFQ